MKDAEEAVAAAEGIAREHREDPDAVIPLRVPEWPHTGFEEWTLFGAHTITPSDGPPIDVPDTWRARLLTDFGGVILAVQLEITRLDINEHAPDLLTFISMLTHQAFEQLATTIGETRQHGAD